MGRGTTLQAQPYPSNINRALQWLSTNQSSDGSFGPGLYFEHWTAASAYALWLNDSSSSKANRAYSYLSASLSNQNSWYWGQYGESDVPGSILYSIAAANQTSHATNISLAGNLLKLQNSTTGGFQGYFDPKLDSAQPGSSVDTASALLGLLRSGTISQDRIQSATRFLFELQNQDGSFNLTKDTPNDPLYSLGPDNITITALVTMSLGQASLKTTEPHMSKALHFLKDHVTSLFLSGHVYDASLSAIALDELNQTADANNALGFVISQQGTDGGFRDSSRTALGSNALDTGWAAIALQTVKPTPTSAPEQTSTTPGPSLSWIFIGAIVAAGVITILSIVAFVVTRKRHDQPVAS